MNDRPIAREVVAVDGHYGVRVLELVSGDANQKGPVRVISRSTILVLAFCWQVSCWRFASLAVAGRRRRLNLLVIEVAGRLPGKIPSEVFKLKHYRVLRPNAGLFPSTNMSSLRYIKGANMKIDERKAFEYSET